MKNFTPLVLFLLLICSCKKENDAPYTNPPTPPSPAPAPASSVTITVGGVPMNITSLSYNRNRSTYGGGFYITATNNKQKVTATAVFSQYYAPWSMIYTMEVSYFTGSDSLAAWGVTHPRPVPRDDRIYFNNGDPLTDKVTNGNFSGSFIVGSGPSKEEHLLVVNGAFSLVF